MAESSGKALRCCQTGRHRDPARTASRLVAGRAIAGRAANHLQMIQPPTSTIVAGDAENEGGAVFGDIAAFGRSEPVTSRAENPEPGFVIFRRGAGFSPALYGRGDDVHERDDGVPALGSAAALSEAELVLRHSYGGGRGGHLTRSLEAGSWDSRPSLPGSPRTSRGPRRSRRRRPTVSVRRRPVSGVLSAHLDGHGRPRSLLDGLWPMAFKVDAPPPPSRRP